MSLFETQTVTEGFYGPLRPGAAPLALVCISNRNKWASLIYMEAPSPLSCFFHGGGGVWVCATLFLLVCTRGVCLNVC
jgi:hypothetical protein